MAVSGVISSCDTSASSWRRALSGCLERTSAVGELVAHLVERSRERRHLVAAAIGRARGHVAGAEADGRFLQLPHACRARGPKTNSAISAEPTTSTRSADERHRRRQLADDHPHRRPSEQHGHRADRDAIDEDRGELTEAGTVAARRGPVVIGPARDEHAAAGRELAARHLAPQRVAHVVRDSDGMIGQPRGRRA